MIPSMINLAIFVVYATSVSAGIDSVGRCINGTCGHGYVCYKEIFCVVAPKKWNGRVKRNSATMCNNNMAAVAGCHTPYSNDCNKFQSNLFGCCGRTDLSCEQNNNLGMNLCCPQNPNPGAITSMTPNPCLPNPCDANCQYRSGCHTAPPSPQNGNACTSQFVQKFNEWLSVCPNGQICVNSMCVPGECKATQSTCPSNTRETYPCNNNENCPNNGWCINGKCCEPISNNVNYPAYNNNKQICPPGACNQFLTNAIPGNRCCGNQPNKFFRRN